MSRLYLKLAKKAIVGLIILAETGLPVATLARVPNDPSFISQAPFYNQINAPAAWNYTTGSRSVVVAVIDTGADAFHDDLAANIWKNIKEIPGNNLDDDANGYIDDVYGWNFVENTNETRTSVFDSEDDVEAVLHGTVIAGLVGAVGNNDRNGTGLNWQVSVMPIRAIGSSGTGKYSNLIRAVRYAMDNGADVITMSFTGSYNNDSFKQVLRQAYDQGIVIVAAAGNHKDTESGNLDETPVYPACYDKGSADNWIIAVGSVDLNDRVSDFSNYGSCVDVWAPGEGIYSVERYAPQYGYTMPFGGEWRGSSFSAPLVAGAAALIKSFRPSFNASLINSLLLDTTDPVTSSNVNQEGFIKNGRINIGRALKTIAEMTPEKPVGSLYRLAGSRVQRFDMATNEASSLITLTDERLLSLAANANETTVALLFRREQFYFTRFIEQSGKFISEISLSIPYRPTLLVKKIRFTGAQDGGVVVEQYDTKRKVTVFTVFDAAGNKTAEFEVAGVVAGWDAGKRLNEISFAQPIKNTLVVTQVDLEAQTKNKYTLRVSGTVEDVRLGPVTAEGGEQTVLLVRQGKDVNQYIVSVASQSYSKEYSGPADPKRPWQLRLVSFPPYELYTLLAYRPGGSYNAKDNRGTVFGAVTVPNGQAVIY